MFSSVMGIVINIIDWFTLLFMLDLFFVRRNITKVKEIITVISAYLSFFVIVRAFASHLELKQLAMILLLTIFSMIIYEAKLLKSIFVSILIFLAGNIMDIIIILLLPQIVDVNLEPLVYSEEMTYLIVLLSRFALFFLVIMLRRKILKTKQPESVSNMLESIWIRYLYFPILSLIAMLFIVKRTLEHPSEDRIMFIIMLLLVSINFFIYNLIKSTLKVENEHKGILVGKIEAESELRLYKENLEHYEQQQKDIHEFNNKLRCIDGLLDNGKYEEAKTYIESIVEIERTTHMLIQTENDLVNAIVNNKYDKMLKKDILFIFNIGTLTGMNMSDLDLVTILGNLLDNAIEACEKCEDGKYIKLKLGLEPGENFIISVRNSSIDDAIIVNDKFKTTKKDVKSHGFGLANIIDLVKKYDGEYVCRYKNGEFLFTAILPKSRIFTQKSNHS